MKLWIIGGIVVVLFVVGIVIMIYDNYKYPVCDNCGSNAKSKRVKGKIVCEEHGVVG